jgi:hypothetical protein
MKTLMRTCLIEMDEELLQNIEGYFSPDNEFYLEFITTLTSHTLYTLPYHHLQCVVQKMLEEPDDEISYHRLITIGNSLINDPTNWRVVMDNFMMYAQKITPPFTYSPIMTDYENAENQIIDYSRYGMLSYYMYFLHKRKT